MDEQPGNFVPQSVTEQMNLSLMQRLDSDMIKDMLRPEDILQEIEHKFRNERWIIKDGRGQWWRGPNVKPIVNETGINNIMGWITPLTSRAVMLSYFEDKDIRIILKELDFDVIDQISANCYDWDIDENNLSFVNKLILTLMWASLNRALLGGERDFLGKTTERRELVGTQERKPKSWVGKILSGGN